MILTVENKNLQACVSFFFSILAGALILIFLAICCLIKLSIRFFSEEEEEYTISAFKPVNLPHHHPKHDEMRPKEFLKLETVQRNIDKMEAHFLMLQELKKLKKMDYKSSIAWHEEVIKINVEKMKANASRYAREEGKKANLIHTHIDNFDFSIQTSETDITIVHDTDLGTYVEGNTLEHKEIIKKTGLRWKPSKRIWGKLKSVGHAPRTRAMTDIAMILIENKLTVSFRIEDASAEEYTEAKIIDMRERSERYQERAEKTHAKAEQSYQASKAISDRIPFGQPILVGHHSERHARADAKRIHNHMNKFVEHHQKANRQEAKAKNLEARAKFLEKHAPTSSEGAENMNKNYTDMLELIKKKTKKISPIVSQVKKDADGKGLRKWAIYTIRFHCHNCEMLRLYVENDQLRVSIGHWGQSISFDYSDGIEAVFKKFEEFVTKYIEQNYEPVTYSNDNFSARFDIDGFHISDLSDMINMPTAIDSRTSKRDLAKVFKWSQGKKEKFQKLTYSQMVSAISKECDVRVHTYCAMD